MELLLHTWPCISYMKRVYSTDLVEETNKTQVGLAYSAQAQEEINGKNKILVFEQGVQHMLKWAMTCNYQDVPLLAKCCCVKFSEMRATKRRAAAAESYIPPCMWQDSLTTIH